MAGKPSPKKKSAAADDPVLREQRKLLEKEQEIHRERAKLNRTLKEAPAKFEALKKKQREPVILKLNAAPGVRTGFTLRDKRGEVAPGARRNSARKSERDGARVKFVVLCLILLTIVFLIWRTIP